MEDDTPQKLGFNIIRNHEALALLLLSVASYIFTYSSQKAYLRSFGIDEMFVMIELTAVLRSGVWLIGSLTVLIYIWNAPLKPLIWLLKFAFVLRTVLLFGGLSWLVYSASGVVWLTVILIVLTALLLITECTLVCIGAVFASAFAACSNSRSLWISSGSALRMASHCR